MSDDPKDDPKDLQPIPLDEVRQRKKSKKAAPPMKLEEARAVIEKVVANETDPGAPFEPDALKAAATLKQEDVPAFERLYEELRGRVDLRRWMASVKGAQRALVTTTRRQGDDRLVILDKAELHEMVDVCMRAIIDRGIYQREGELVELVEDKSGPRIRPVPVDKLRTTLSRVARFERVLEEGTRPIKPPRDVVLALHAHGEWDLPVLRGFIDGACVLEDGEVLCTEGYHPSAQLFVRNACAVSGLRAPAQEDARQAYEELANVFVDFEFAQPRGPHLSAVIAGLLTMVARPGIDGCTPMFLFDANRPRMGKTLLAQIICEIVTGSPPSLRPAPSGRDADSEMRKQITSIARSGRPVVVFDNVKGKLGGPALEGALTSRWWSDRVLGATQETDAELRVTWIATSNNAELTPDMHGRCLVARLETNHEAPELRADWAHDNILRHVRINRGRYLSAAIRILRAWHLAGRPEYKLSAWGSFEEWSRTIRNALVFAGAEDPCHARASLVEADSESRALLSVLSTWPLDEEYTAAQLARGMKEGKVLDTMGRSYRDVVDALEELLNSSSTVAIGKRLSIYRGRVLDGRRLVARRDTSTNATLWRVEKVSKD